MFWKAVLYLNAALSLTLESCLFSDCNHCRSVSQIFMQIPVASLAPADPPSSARLPPPHSDIKCHLNRKVSKLGAGSREEEGQQKPAQPSPGGRALTAWPSRAAGQVATRQGQKPRDSDQAASIELDMVDTLFPSHFATTLRVTMSALQPIRH